MEKQFVLMITLGALALSATMGAFGQTTQQGIAPKSFEGNLPGGDLQVCYDLMNLGLIKEVTGDMIGVKVDPPINFSNGVSTTLSADGKYLDWTSAAGIMVLGFVIKGGPAYNVYDYVGKNFNWDKGLASPPLVKTKSIPQISHYNFCYLKVGTQGCTPGYWRNHYDRWSGYSAVQTFDQVFGVQFFGTQVTLGQAISSPQTYGTFAFHAVAALLNAAGGVPNLDLTKVNYKYTEAEVIGIVQDAVTSGGTEAAKSLLATANEAGCPLSGTPACSSKNPTACVPQ